LCSAAHRANLFLIFDFLFSLCIFKIFIFRYTDSNGGCPMYFVAAVLVVLAGLFYAAGNNELGSWGSDMCRYGSTFCDNPVYVLVGAILAAVWGRFVSIR